MTIPVAIVWLLEQDPAGITLLTVALVGEILLLPLIALIWSLRRESAFKLIATGGGSTGETAELARALDDPRHRDRRIADLQRALHEAERWHELPVTRRPPPSARRLATFRDEVEGIISLLGETDASPAGLALLELFLLGGYGSLLYVGDLRTVGEQLWRIRFLLSQRRDRYAATASA